jgi:hypothetical protein
MGEPEADTMHELDDTQAEADGSTMPKTEEKTAPETKDEVGNKAKGEQQQERKDDNFGMSVLAGEIQEYDPDKHDSHPFE